MSRSVMLFTSPFTDRPLEEVVSKAAEWGYTGLELSTWGDHLEIQRALADADYCQMLLDLFSRHEITSTVIAAFRVSTAVCDVIDERHEAILPDYVWGDGEPNGVRERAIEEMMAIARVAERLGVQTVSGFLGSPIWSWVMGWPAPKPEMIDAAFERVVQTWLPILEVFRDCGVRYAYEIHPGQIAHDFYTAERLLDAFGEREEFGFTLDPSHFLWQGLDPVEFLHHFHSRVYHVHIKDAIVALNGRAGLLGSFWPSGDRRRGWQYRSPGHGGVDWASFIRALNRYRYEGPLSVDWHDPDMDREHGVEDACQFVQRLDFPPRN